MAKISPEGERWRDLRQTRLDQGKSLYQLAPLIGVSWATLRRAETGSIPHPTNAVKIANYFGQRPQDLWGNNTKTPLGKKRKQQRIR